MARKPLTVHYRRLVDVTGAFGGMTLEQAIRKAMSSLYDGGPLDGHWKRRAWLVPPQDEDTLLLNLNQAGSNYYFGDLTMYSRGYMQLLLSNLADSPVLNVKQEPPPAGMEYVHSIMYWMAVGNHVMLIQSSSLAAKQLEQYLTWLLRDRTGLLNATGQVQLQAKFDLAEVGGQLDDVREIVVGGMSMAPVHESQVMAEAAPVVRDVEEYRTLDTRSPGQKRGFEVLRALFSNEADLNRLLECVPEDAQLEVSVHIGYKSKKRKVSRAPMQQALRNLPEGEVRAIGRDGKMSGNDIRLSHPVSVISSGRMLDPDDVVRALHSAYNYFVDNGKIVP